MNTIKILTTLTISILTFAFSSACSRVQQDRLGQLGPSSGIDADAGTQWAKDEFDLQRIGPLIERSHSPEEFETYLNQDDGINNLDLNGDGYADYISVEEFYDQGPYARGLSLYDRFGPDQIQDLATVYFYRDDPYWQGARVLVVGDDNIYGDNVYYETNWYDRPLDLVSYIFGTHDVYRSPYYYDNYPRDYVVYDVVETPVYVSRVQRLYPEPVLVYTQQRPAFIDKIKIKSPNANKRIDQVFAQLAKPTRGQQKFIAENHPRPEHAKNDKPGRPYIPPGLEKRADNLPPGIERRNGGLPPGQLKEHVAEKQHGHENRPVMPRQDFRPPKQVPQVARNSEPRAKMPKPQPQVGRPAPQVKPQFNRPAPQMAKPGPPAQRGGGGGKKKG